MGLILYGMLMAHLVGYKDEYMRIGTTFATTMMVKLVIKQANKDHATMIGLGGGFCVIKDVAILLEKVTKKGFNVLGTNNVGGQNGIVGDMLKNITELLAHEE
ncbi:MAG TPA: hypothetical protein VIM70_10625 [Clostridium sp.]|uniref:hypothetical protein n=1 Tax=Clostridium sp. TaxID=1506 RepID=UPI002F940552